MFRNTARFCPSSTVLVEQDQNLTDDASGPSNLDRGLALVPGLGFISASHDTTLQLWTTGGDPIATLAGHTALVYR